MSQSSNTPPDSVVRKCAVVMGGARGIGETIVRRLIQDGHRVLIADRLAPELDALSADLRQNGADVQTCVTDITREEDHARLAEQAAKFFGAGNLNAAVNSVGFFSERRPLLQTPLDRFRLVIDVNLTGAYLFSKAMVPLMAPNASLVHIGSVNGEEAGSDLTAYKMAKAALHMMGRCLALELAKDPRRIRSNIVAPGWVVTPGEIEVWKEHNTMHYLNDISALGYIPLGRRTEAREVADAVGFLCSPAGSGITGTIIPVDCGILARNA